MLYQQGTNRIEVIVRKERNSGVAGTIENDSDAISSNDNTSVATSGMSDIRKRRLIKTNTTHGLAVFHQVTDLGLNYYIGGMGLRNGDQAYQDGWQRTTEIVQDTTNVATSVAMGIAYGSWGGPIGAAFGAVFGAVSSGASLAVKYLNREREYNYKIFKENNAIEYNRARAGVNLTNGRLR